VYPGRASAAADCPAAFGRTDKAVRPYLLPKMARFLNHAKKIIRVFKRVSSKAFIIGVEANSPISNWRQAVICHRGYSNISTMPKSVASLRLLTAASTIFGCGLWPAYLFLLTER
jgi:hypothetical protein